MKPVPQLPDARFLTFSAIIFVLACLLIALPFRSSTSAKSTTMPHTQALTDVTVWFRTTYDDRRDDTLLSVYVYRPNGDLVARIENIRDYFGNGSEHFYRLELNPNYPIPPDRDLRFPLD